MEFTGSGKPLTEAAFDDAINRLQCDPAALWAILSVETRGFGYLADRRPKILYERHIFAARTGRKFDAANPDISSSTPGGYIGGAGEFDRLGRAIQLDRRAALESASWGLEHIMGFNAGSLSYPRRRKHGVPVRQHRGCAARRRHPIPVEQSRLA